MDPHEFYRLCVSDLEKAKMMHSRDEVDIHAGNDCALRWSCENGHLEVAQWLHSQGADIRVWNDCAFRWSCVKGHLEVAQWLHSQGANIHAQNDHAFRRSCLNGHLKVAQWLHLRGADIHAKNDCAFERSCENGRLEVAQWLCEIEPRYHITRASEPISYHIMSQEEWDAETLPLTKRAIAVE